MNQEKDKRYISGTPQHGEGGVWPPHSKGELLPDIAEAVQKGMDLIRGELMPLLEKRVGAEKASEIEEMLEPHITKFHNPEVVRTYVAIEELAAQDLLDAEQASELFYLMKESIIVNPDEEWRRLHGRDSKGAADKLVWGLIAQSKLSVIGNGEKRSYAVTDLTRYEKEKDLAA